ncbi:MAG: hypothetical protein GY861_21890 [bacterium]|nr:hypothetical protein [bacterium]
MVQLLRDALLSTGLFIEGTEAYSCSFPVNTYYGFNVTKTNREPIDQIHGFIAAARIKERNKKNGQKGMFFPFVAGVFEVLNTTNQEQIRTIVETNENKEQHKKKLFKRIARRFSLPTQVLLTNDLWGNQIYWDIFAEILKKSAGQFSKGSLTQDTLVWYRGREDELEKVNKIKDIAPDLMDIPGKLLRKIGDWPAAIIYTPIEVSEAVYMVRQKKVLCKIGHMDETVYDKYIMQYMDIVHLRQPMDLGATRLKPVGVTPYIDKKTRDQKIRIFFDDTPQSIRERMSQCKLEEYTFTWSPRFGEVLNPVLDKLVLAIESARIMGLTPIQISKISISTGMELIKAITNNDITIAELAETFPEVIFRYLIEPFA